MTFLRLPELPQQIIPTLSISPEESQRILLDGQSCTAEICIPDAKEKISRHYRDLLPDGLSALITAENLPQAFRHFGIQLRFEDPALLDVYDQELVLVDDLKVLLNDYGAVMLENAYMPEPCRNEAQRNIFPDLDFHFDRPPSAPNCYSLFFRDPFDATHHAKRESSTLIIPNVVAYLQLRREGSPAEECKRTMYRIFRQTDIDSLVNDVLLEQQWRAPEGIGEICLIDNRSVFHASYYRRGKGYPIGVRYLF